MDSSTPLGIDWTISLRSIPLNSTWCSQCHSHRSTFDVLHQTDLCITRLRCAEPPTITFATVLSRDPFLAPRPDPTNPHPRRVTPIGICKTAVLREPITIFRTRHRSTLRTLEFWLSVRLKVNLHDVLNLSSIRHDVLDLFP